MKLLPTILCLMAWPLSLGAESFESYSTGSLSRLSTGLGTWAASSGHTSIHTGHAHGGEQSLRILGGKNHGVTLTLSKLSGKNEILSFWAERWTTRSPFAFSVEARTKHGWKKIYSGDKTVKVGGFHTQVKVALPAGTKELRFIASTPKGSGVMIDDLNIGPVRPMVIKSITAIQPVVPALIRKKHNPVFGLKVITEGQGSPVSLTDIAVNLAGTLEITDVKSISILHGGSHSSPGKGAEFGSTQKAPHATAAVCHFAGNAKLNDGENFFWVCVELSENASLDRRVDGAIVGVKINDKSAKNILEKSPAGSQRIGYAVRQHGDDGSKFFRIPGFTTTNKGTLIGVYDIRYRHGGDLPADIDVGMSRSTDGGQTWEKMKVIMDMGEDPKWKYDGIGDPAVLVDHSNNRIWVAALWSHGNRAWRGSGPGLKPDETAQFVLVYSDDDGLSWSKPINITRQVKDEKWRLFFNGPGMGICTKKGALIFPAQYRDAKGVPWSTLIYSKDQGKTWHSGTGVKSNTTEAQLVQLGDGSIMINCRDNRGGSRTVAITKDLGKTWTMHPTDRKALNDPVCMASLIRITHQKYGSLLIFSNPNTRRGRYNMTIKVSHDDGMTWPKEYHTLYDSRRGSGYSCLTRVGKDKVGVYYEGSHEIYYLRFPISELVREDSTE